MKLYLSSVGIPDKEAFGSLIATRSANIGFIANAWDVYPAEKAEPFIQGRLRELEEMGFTIRPIDLRETTDISAALGGLGGVWVTGGNTFYLNWLMRQSGFDRAITQSIRTGLVYGGESAGSVIIGPTLHGVELMDDPSQAPEVIWDGLGLVGFGMVPHWNNPKYTEKLGQYQTEMQKFANVVKTINDGEYILINEGS